MDNGGVVIIDDIHQELLYYLLPKSNNDMLHINMPLYINAVTHSWIVNKSTLDIYLKSSSNRKYVFKGATVEQYISCVNRYGVNSRDVLVSFLSFFDGYRR